MITPSEPHPIFSLILLISCRSATLITKQRIRYPTIPPAVFIIRSSISESRPTKKNCMLSIASETTNVVIAIFHNFQYKKQANKRSASCNYFISHIVLPTIFIFQCIVSYFTKHYNQIYGLRIRNYAPKNKPHSRDTNRYL